MVTGCGSAHVLHLEYAGGVHIPYTPDDLFDTPGTFGRLPSGLRQYLSPQYRHPVFPSARDTTTGVVPFRHVKPGAPLAYTSCHAVI